MNYYEFRGVCTNFPRKTLRQAVDENMVKLETFAKQSPDNMQKAKAIREASLAEVEWNEEGRPYVIAKPSVVALAMNADDQNISNLPVEWVHYHGWVNRAIRCPMKVWENGMLPSACLLKCDHQNVLLISEFGSIVEGGKVDGERSIIQIPYTTGDTIGDLAQSKFFRKDETKFFLRLWAWSAVMTSQSQYEYDLLAADRLPEVFSDPVKYHAAKDRAARRGKIGVIVGLDDDIRKTVSFPSEYELQTYRKNYDGTKPITADAT